MNPTLIVLFLGGTASGFVSALLGIGGAVILIPYLITVEPLLGGPSFTPFEATQIAIYQVLAASLSGYIFHRPSTLLPTRTLALWGLCALVGSALGGYFSHALPGRTILEVYLAEILLAGFLLARPLKHRDGVDYTFRRQGLAPVIMGLIGMISGLLGIGGGFLYYPVMTGILGYASHIAVGSSLGIMIPMALAGVLGKTVASGHIPVATWPVVGGALIGAISGARLNRKLEPRMVRWGQGLLLAATFTRIFLSLL